MSTHGDMEAGKQQPKSNSGPPGTEVDATASDATASATAAPSTEGPLSETLEGLKGQMQAAAEAVVVEDEHGKGSDVGDKKVVPNRKCSDVHELAKPHAEVADAGSDRNTESQSGDEIALAKVFLVSFFTRQHTHTSP